MMRLWWCNRYMLHSRFPLLFIRFRCGTCMENVANGEFYLERGSLYQAFLYKQPTPRSCRVRIEVQNNWPERIRAEKSCYGNSGFIPHWDLIQFCFCNADRLGDAQSWLGYVPYKKCATSPSIIPPSTNPTKVEREGKRLFPARRPPSL